MPAAPPDAAAPSSDRRPAFAPTRAESGAVALLAAGALAAFTVAARPGEDPTPHRGAACRLDVNAATAAEWSLLRGVGPVLAHRIVTDRTARGVFHAPPDLLAVKGVGPKTYSRLGPHLRFPSSESSGRPPSNSPLGGPALAAR